jgi:hypothetical protein
MRISDKNNIPQSLQFIQTLLLVIICHILTFHLPQAQSKQKLASRRHTSIQVLLSRQRVKYTRILLWTTLQWAWCILDDFQEKTQGIPHMLSISLIIQALREPILGFGEGIGKCSCE